MIFMDIQTKFGNAFTYYDYPMLFELSEKILDGAIRIREADLSKGGKIEDISAPDKSVRTIRAEFLSSYGSTLTIFAAFNHQPHGPSEIILHPTDDPDLVMAHLSLHEPDYAATQN